MLETAAFLKKIGRFAVRYLRQDCLKLSKPDNPNAAAKADTYLSGWVQGPVFLDLDSHVMP